MEFLFTCVEVKENMKENRRGKMVGQHGYILKKVRKLNEIDPTFYSLLFSRT